MINAKVTVGKATMTFVADDREENIELDFLLEEIEKAVIGKCLDQQRGVKARVADMLTMNRTTLVEKCRRYGFPLKRR